ncbi:MAG: Fic family protein [Desulfofustis sp. PB-SRB1]|nr:Fic family protein [Desulfofustis sp. PB-SRB1]MBM1003780.1 Fic family protein [Desulfofustis sp. PB-SRB1]
MAAAYLFHLVKKHPFLDGYKRVGTGVGVPVAQRPRYRRAKR